MDKHNTDVSFNGQLELRREILYKLVKHNKRLEQNRQRQREQQSQKLERNRQRQREQQWEGKFQQWKGEFQQEQEEREQEQEEERELREKKECEKYLV